MSKYIHKYTPWWKGGGGGGSYDDTAIKRRITALESGKQNVLVGGDGIILLNDTISAVNILNDTRESSTTVWSSNKVKSLFDTLQGQVDIVITPTKPAKSSAVNKTMYYVGTESPYHIWFFVNDDYTDFGTTELDLSNYFTKAEINELLELKVDKVVGKSLVLDTDIAQITTNKVDIANIKDDETITSFGKVKLEFEKKVDKVTGKSLVSDTDITQITTNKTDIATLKTDKQDKITDSSLSSLSDSTTVSSLSASSKTNKTFALSSLWDYIKGKITEVYYPVGSVVTSLTDTSPATAYGGTWEKIGEYPEWDIVDWTDINLNSSSSSGLSLDTSTKHLGTLSVASGHRAKYRVDADGTMHISMRFKHSTTRNYTSSSYADVGTFKYKGTKLANDCDVWFIGALSGSDKGYATISVHILQGGLYFSCTSDNPVSSIANTTQNFVGGSFKLAKSTCDRTYYKFKRTA